jgi:putative membrane protein
MGAVLLAAVYVYAQQSNNPREGYPNPVDQRTGQVVQPGTQVIQQPGNQPGQVTQGTVRNDERGMNANQEQNLDKILATRLLTGTKAEVELGNLAEQRASDRDIKAFAQQMVKDHSQQVETLQRFIGGQEPTDRRSQIDKQIAERCLANLKRELESKSGKDFDDCYIGAQIGGHMQMAAALAVISEQTSGQLHSIAKEAQPTVDRHLDQAKKLMDQLDKGSSSRQASNERERER